MTKFNSNLDSLASYSTTGPYARIPFNLIYISGNSQIKVSYFGESITPGTTGCNIVNFDKNLNLLNSKSLPNYFVSQATLLNDSDTTYIISATCKTAALPLQHIVTAKLNNQDSILNQVFISLNQDTLLSASGVENVAKSSNNIFVTGTYNVNPLQFPWQSSPDWILVEKLNPNLNVINHYLFGGDAFYVPMNTIPTSDGGIFLTGYRFDYLLPGNHQDDIFVLKLDSNCSLTGIPEIGLTKDKAIWVFPNPASDLIKIIINPKYDHPFISIINNLGQTVKEDFLYSTDNILPISDLKPGIYIYKASSDKKAIGQGKFIKY